MCRDDPSCREAATRRGALERSLRVGKQDLARLAEEIDEETR